MVILQKKQEERQNLEEMARFKGYGVTLEVRSNDHGELGNISNPAHAHVLNNAGREIAEIVLTQNIPTRTSDVLWYRTGNPPDGLAAHIVKLANMPNQSLKRVGINAATWQAVVYEWMLFHEN